MQKTHGMFSRNFLFPFFRLVEDSTHAISRLSTLRKDTLFLKLFLTVFTAGYWSEEEIERLDAAVRASTGTEFGSQIYGDINWVEVSTFVMTRTSDQCRKKW